MRFMLIRKKQILAIYLFLTLVTLIGFWQVSRCDFISYDDPKYVTENVHLRQGITIQAVRWAFTTFYASNWHPLTWMSHMLDVQLFGLNPYGHHLINLLFHISNSLLLFFVFHRITKAPWKSAFVAALFALHPLHVESVAWVAERKDVLSAFFWMLTIVAYVNYVDGTEDGRRRTEDGKKRAGILRFPSSVFRYSAVLASYALGLMAKPMLVTLPFVLLLLDYWPLQRFEQKTSAEEIRTEVKKSVYANKKKGKSGRKLTVQAMAVEGKQADDKYYRAVIRPLLWEKLPLFALAALSCIVTFIAQQKGGAVKSIELFTPGVRIANALVSYILYMLKTVWPDNLAVFYPHPWLVPFWQVFGAALLLIAVTLIAIRKARRYPFLPVGWLWFTGTLVPVIGVVQVGGQAMADRYTYIPLIGLFIIAAWGIPALFENWRYRKEALFALWVLTLPCLFVVTWTQLGFWRNSIALCDHALKVTNNNDTIHTCRGATYAKLGNYKQAIEDYDRAIQINPEYALAYLNRGVAYSQIGNPRQAISDYDRAIQINPEYAFAYLNRGVSYSQIGNQKQAISDYNRAIEINPEDADEYYNRGIAYVKLGNQGQSIEDYDRAIQINPEYALAYLNRGVAYNQIGNPRQAILDYDRAIQINPEYALAYLNRGVAYSQIDNQRQAISDYNRAIEINPVDADEYYNRGIAYVKLGNQERAIEDYDRAIQINPEYALAYLNRGIAHVKRGNYRQAISDYDRAIQINPEYALAYLNRGVAYVKLDNHGQAISDYGRAIQINPEYALAYLNRGVAYSQIDNEKQAISDYSRAIEINPGYADAYNYRGMAYGKLGNHQQAILDFDKAVEINPEYAGAYINRGVVYSHTDNQRQAIADFDRTIRINPESAVAYYYRGFAYGKLGNQRQAAEDLQKAAGLGNEDAKNLLKSQGAGIAGPPPRDPGAHGHRNSER
jgi:protein O-mannosyl-transferase